MIRRRFLAAVVVSGALVAAVLTYYALHRGAFPLFGTPNLSVASRNAALAAITARIDGGGSNGVLVVYSGAQPAGPDTALSGNTALATLKFSSTSFAAPSGGTATANAITSATATATGTATFARAYSTSDGSTPGTAVVDFSVGVSGTDIVLGSTAIASGQGVVFTSLTLTHQ